MFLLDTNVVSEFRKLRPHGAVIAWLRTVSSSDLSIPAVVFGEMQYGIERTRLQNPAKAADIESYAESLMHTYAIVPMDALIFREFGRIIHEKSREFTEDAMIAATARVHRLTVVTRNVKDFEGFGVQILNPFEFVEGTTKSGVEEN
jgi:predicted nucleic acid-binding protein